MSPATSSHMPVMEAIQIVVTGWSVAMRRRSHISWLEWRRGVFAAGLAKQMLVIF